MIIKCDKIFPISHYAILNHKFPFNLFICLWEKIAGKCQASAIKYYKTIYESERVGRQNDLKQFGLIKNLTVILDTEILGASNKSRCSYPIVSKGKQELLWIDSHFSSYRFIIYILIYIIIFPLAFVLYT